LRIPNAKAGNSIWDNIGITIKNPQPMANYLLKQFKMLQHVASPTL